MKRSTRKTLASAVAAGMAASGLIAALNAKRRSRGDYRVFVLDYHDVVEDLTEPEGTVSTERFRRHLRYLKRHFTFCSLAHAGELLRSNDRLDRDYLVVTLDDGYAGNYDNAFPVLIDEEVPATVFVATAFIDGRPLWTDLARRAVARFRPDTDDPSTKIAARLDQLAPGWRRGEADVVDTLKSLPLAQRDDVIEELVCCVGMPHDVARPMTWEQIGTMHTSGIEIGAHTVNHPILPTLHIDEQLREMEESRIRIRDMIGHTPQSFAYPNGNHDERTVEMARKAGFAVACTTVRGSNRPGCDLYRLQRFGIGADTESLLGMRLVSAFEDTVRSHARMTGPDVGLATRA